MKNSTKTSTYDTTTTNKGERKMEKTQQFQVVGHGKRETVWNGMWSNSDTYQEVITCLLGDKIELTEDNILEYKDKIETRVRKRQQVRDNIDFFQTFRLTDMVEDFDTTTQSIEIIKETIDQLIEAGFSDVEFFELYHLVGLNYHDITMKTGKTKRQIEYILSKHYRYLAANSDIYDYTNPIGVWGKPSPKRSGHKLDTNKYFIRKDKDNGDLAVVCKWETEDNEYWNNTILPSKVKHLGWNKYFDSLHNEATNCELNTVSIPTNSVTAKAVLVDKPIERADSDTSFYNLK